MHREETWELRWFLAVIRRRVWLIGGCTLLAVIVAFLVVSRLPAVYEATTTLLMAPAESASASEYTSLMAGERLALTYGQILKARSTLQAVIARLGLAETPETLAKKIKAEVVANTQLVRVTARASAPSQAAQIANTVADIFIDSAKSLQAERYRGLISGKEAENAAQSQVVAGTQAQIAAGSARKVANESDLARLQGLLADCRTAERAFQQDRESLQLLLAQTRNQVRIVEAARPPAAGARVPYTYTATVTLWIDQRPVDPADDYSAVLTSERLAGTYAQMLVGPSVLEAAIAKLGVKQGPDAWTGAVKAQPISGTQLMRLQVAGKDAPQAVNLANAMAQVFVEQLQTMLGQLQAERLADTEAPITGLAAQIASLQAQIDARAAAKLQDENELAQLQSQLAESRSDARVLQQEHAQLLFAAAQASGMVVVAERAAEPHRPARSLWQYLMLAALGALFLSLGGAFLLEHLDDTLKTPDDIRESLGLSTFGAIERFAAGASGPVVASEPQSGAAEAFRLLAANIRFARADLPGRMLLVTSASAVEGKSVVAANLAVAMAKAGQRVVLVDADLRLPRLYQLFGMSQGQGLTEALGRGGLDGHLQATAIDGVNLLTSGTLPPDPVRVVSSDRLPALLAELRETAYLVVIDSPLILAVADMGRRCPGILPEQERQLVQVQEARCKLRLC